MSKTFRCLPFLLFFSALLPAQESVIDTVHISDSQLQLSKKFQPTTTLHAADIAKNSTTLSDLLRFQSPVFLKENGRGMVSSPSFRGTTAQQTLFLWNGLTVNSIFLGQGDTNNLGLLGYDRIEVKSGGGSVIYGSGAIGGTVHLNNQLLFNRGVQASALLEGGSFGTFSSFLKAAYSDEKLSVKIAGTHTESENEYEVPARRYKNLNGHFANQSVELALAYRLNARHTLSWQTQVLDGSQNYPVFSEFATRTKYLSHSFRSMAGWKMRTAKTDNLLQLALLEDEFGYFGDVEQPTSSGGTSKTYVAKNDFNYSINDRFAFNFLGEFRFSEAAGYRSGIAQISRKQGSVAALARWKPIGKMRFEAGVRKDLVEGLESPLFWSFSGTAQVAPFYELVVNASSNFRFPSFNDLYWSPGGNPDLKAETSVQAEIGNRFKIKNLSLNITPFYLNIKDMIRWIPGRGGIWSPVNTDEVTSYGLEAQLDFKKNFGRNELLAQAGYGFTHSEDRLTGKLLPYVPQHKVYGTLTYRRGGAELYVQGLSTGGFFTTPDEGAEASVAASTVFNAGLSATLLKKYRVGVKVQNLFDEVYETAAHYPLPLRNYSLFILINLK